MQTEGRNAIHRQWLFLNKLPLGALIFSYFVNRYIPYTGSISARVLELKPGYARVLLRDRRKVRNHLHSIHAIALANLAEYTGNLALVCGLPEDARFIVKNIAVDYQKKARGTLVGECQTEIVATAETRDISVRVDIRDQDGDTVATGLLLTRIGPKK